jgi:hypothetical protein
MPYFPEDRRVGPSPFWGRGRSGARDSAAAPDAANGQVHERNGIWVAMFGGAWLGDYTRRDDALAAIRTAVRAARQPKG